MPRSRTGRHEWRRTPSTRRSTSLPRNRLRFMTSWRRRFGRRPVVKRSPEPAGRGFLLSPFRWLACSVRVAGALDQGSVVVQLLVDDPAALARRADCDDVGPRFRPVVEVACEAVVVEPIGLESAVDADGAA